MFTGLIEEVGKVVSFIERAEAWELIIESNLVVEDAKLGDSIAVNGCCLTVVEIDGKRLSFELLGETVRLTGFSSVQQGSLVNLERCLTPSTRMGGHFVSGHIDGQGEILSFDKEEKNYHLIVRAPKEYLHYLAYKGSITIDGISLTVATVEEDGFSCWIIPHTMKATNLQSKGKGCFVNLEFDILAKYVERMLGKA
jgi:riboflavin synthase